MPSKPAPIKKAAKKEPAKKEEKKEEKAPEPAPEPVPEPAPAEAAPAPAEGEAAPAEVAPPAEGEAAPAPAEAEAAPAPPADGNAPSQSPLRAVRLGSGSLSLKTNGLNQCAAAWSVGVTVSARKAFTHGALRSAPQRLQGRSRRDACGQLRLKRRSRSDVACGNFHTPPFVTSPSPNVVQLLFFCATSLLDG